MSLPGWHVCWRCGCSVLAREPQGIPALCPTRTDLHPAQVERIAPPAPASFPAPLAYSLLSAADLPPSEATP